jgi:hypothetical protein
MGADMSIMPRILLDRLRARRDGTLRIANLGTGLCQDGAHLLAMTNGPEWRGPA